MSNMQITEPQLTEVENQLRQKDVGEMADDIIHKLKVLRNSHPESAFAIASHLYSRLEDIYPKLSDRHYAAEAFD